jgi:hypothetical protein
MLPPGAINAGIPGQGMMPGTATPTAPGALPGPFVGGRPSLPSGATAVPGVGVMGPGTMPAGAGAMPPTQPTGIRPAAPTGTMPPPGFPGTLVPGLVRPPLDPNNARNPPPPAAR